MKSILLVSYCFAPQNAIGAVRPTKLAKEWTKLGYQVTVLCGKGYGTVEDPILKRDLQALADVHMVRERSLLRLWKERGQAKDASPAAAPQATATAADGGKAAKPKASRARPLLNALYLWLADRADRAFARACLRELHGMNRHFDAVFSTYGPLSVHTVAQAAKRQGMADRWIADFRDEAAVPFSWQKGRLARYLRGVTDHADVITSVSAGYLRVMGLENRGVVVHNGFDAEDLRGIELQAEPHACLRFIHCGQMYGAQRDLSPFFRALRELIDEGEIDLQRIELIYAGKDTRGFVDQATQAGLQACLRGYGFLPRDESLKLQKSSDVLLLAAWNLRERQGNLPGKLLEYLMLAMPVLCCVSGDVPNSEVAALIRETNVGFCYEQAEGAAAYAKLKAYVLRLYRAFSAGEPIPFEPNAEAVAGFGYAGVAETMAALMENKGGKP